MYRDCIAEYLDKEARNETNFISEAFITANTTNKFLLLTTYYCLTKIPLYWARNSMLKLFLHFFDDRFPVQFLVYFLWRRHCDHCWTLKSKTSPGGEVVLIWFVDKIFFITSSHTAWYSNSKLSKKTFHAGCQGKHHCHGNTHNFHHWITYLASKK